MNTIIANTNPDLLHSGYSGPWL